MIRCKIPDNLMKSVCDAVEEPSGRLFINRTRKLDEPQVRKMFGRRMYVRINYADISFCYLDSSGAESIEPWFYYWGMRQF